MRKIIVALAAMFVGSAMAAPEVVMGPATAALATCFSDNTTGKERKDFAKFVFFGMSAHPDMQGFTNITGADREELDRTAAAIVTRLLIESCRSQAKLAVEKEGAASFQAAFGTLGMLAMQELMSNPKVASSFTNYSKYLDANKINSALLNK